VNGRWRDRGDAARLSAAETLVLFAEELVRDEQNPPSDVHVFTDYPNL
jgi:hypothetical protein